MNQNNANMKGARGIRVSAHPDDDKIWVTPTIWSEKRRRYVAIEGGKPAHPAFVADIQSIIIDFVSRGKS